MPTRIPEPFKPAPLDGDPVLAEKAVFTANTLSPFLTVLTDGEVVRADYATAGGLEAVFLTAARRHDPYRVNVTGDSLAALSRDVLAAVSRLGY